MDRSFSTCFAIPAAPMPAMDAFVHGGGRDRHGCHHDRKRGGYHCHRAPAPAASPGRAEATYAPRNNLTGNVIRQGSGFKHCRAARAAGVAPVRRGEPGYEPHLDRDNDGVGCE